MAGPESLEVRRERVVQALCAHFARDRLTMEDLEARLEHAQDAQSDAELSGLLADLPALDDIAPVVTPMPGQYFAVARAGDRPPAAKILSLFANVRREGGWTVPPFVEVRSIFGGTRLDLAGATLQPGTTIIDASAVFGEVVIIVPPGVRIESTGSAIFGEFQHKETPLDALDATAPVIQVTGKAVFGSVTIKTWMPKRKALEKLRAQWKALKGSDAS
jgi:hypothetical protein